ncbi:MAG: single-stranded DNA-binding protein [Candidatus Jordarchaeum sp.]|uniref:single-stranded DNA-binding protein n=1 Tax=Candidatus Jordarchaeum sp. TaxID=2823881 RepID=UPI00404AF5CD
MIEPQDVIIENLRPGLKSINVKFKVKSLNEEREVVSKRTGENLRVTEALVGDSSGSILLSLWNDDIDKVKENHVYKLNNGYTTVFKNSLRLNIGKYGSLEEVEDGEDIEVNNENNISDKVYEQERRYRPSYGDSGSRYGGSYGGSRPYRSDRSRGRRY